VTEELLITGSGAWLIRHETLGTLFHLEVFIDDHEGEVGITLVDMANEKVIYESDWPI
jgi:hypothetical protein